MPVLLSAQENKIEPVKTSITVVEKISAETPANVSVVDHEDLQQTPGANLDDRLRQVPGFSLFRRSSSLAAHPTTQGVSLRGIGSSGASRSLVLWDGLPLNDPFGGWVYWSRVSPDELERVEISRGAATSVFGDLALGGAIALWSRAPERRRLHAAYEGGNRDAHDLSAGYADLGSRWAFSGWGRAYTTDGYFIVPQDLRGAVDRMAGVRFVTADMKLEYFAGANHLFGKADILAEERKNGTVLQQNSTGLGMIAMHYVREAAHDGFSVAGFHSREQFHSTFSAIADNRNSERLTVRQTVPAEAVGADALWRHDGKQWNALAGADVYRVEGFSTDALVPAGRRVGGGTLLQHGVFAQANATAGPAAFYAGLRHHFTGRDLQFLSPSAGLTLGRGRLRGRGSVYRSFRAPTLNELFREFRTGNVVTKPNSALRPETLFGAEAGLDWIGETSRIRITAYRNSLEDLITNVTVSSAQNLIVRQRRNAQSALSRGVEFDSERRWRNWRGQLGYLFVDSRFVTGQRIPQVPRHQGSAQVAYQKGGTLAAAGVRSYAAQFEDERNTPQFRMPGFATVQMVLQQRLARGLSALAAFENLLDREYVTGFTPTPTIGAPRLWRVGLRWGAL